MSAVLEVRHLTKDYSGHKAVDDLSFTVGEGEVYGFLGQNGAGKSTTIRMLLTLVQPTAGAITFFGKELRSARLEALRQVGAMIERPDLYGYLTALENLSLFCRLSGVQPGKQRLMDCLTLVGLSDRADSKVHMFSQGMKQRLGLAVALVHDPRLLILDEPTNGMDPQGIADVRALLLKLSREQGKTILVSSHLLSEMEKTADKLLIIHRGKKVAEGAMRDLFDPGDMLVEITVGNGDDLHGIIKQSRWGACLRESYGERLLFQVAQVQIPELLNFLLDSGGRVLAVQPRHSLEHYFLSLTSDESA